MNYVRVFLFFAVFLCFLGCIWSDHPVQWALTGSYAFVVSRFIGNSFRGKVIGEEIQRHPCTVQMTNLIGRK